jgi:SOS-response transcriptional repressor LexA
MLIDCQAQKKRSPKDGDIVVATVEGETTVKRLELGTDGIRLVAENPRCTH